jgi:hypothetical protein
MKTLSKEHQEIILNFGYPKRDLKQIENALSKTDFELYHTEDDAKDEKLTIDQAVEILGEELFLSGICRSAFHWSATRQNAKGQNVYFNSSRLFK